MYVAMMCINNTITAVCQVFGHQAVLVLEAVYKYVTVGLLASPQQMINMIYNHDPNVVILSYRRVC